MNQVPNAMNTAASANGEMENMTKQDHKNAKSAVEYMQANRYARVPISAAWTMVCLQRLIACAKKLSKWTWVLGSLIGRLCVPSLGPWPHVLPARGVIVGPGQHILS
jgi:hypothetical protein